MEECIPARRNKSAHQLSRHDWIRQGNWRAHRIRRRSNTHTIEVCQSQGTGPQRMALRLAAVSWWRILGACRQVQKAL